jgi:inosine-uridine nucleoside N-ribohydrolase
MTIAAIWPSFTCAISAGESILEPEGEEITVIVDTDMGLDDVRALFLLAGSPGISIGAVITTGGSTSAAKAADNAIGLLELSTAGDMPVLRGMTPTLLEPPPWRSHAEALGGAPFPPPRNLSQQPLEKAVGSGGIPEGIWLVLGPLTSISYLEKIAPGTLGDAEVWIPAAVEGERISGWNIGCDPEAALRVLSEAKRVFIVDTSTDLDARRILLDVDGDTPAAQWIDAATGTGSDTHAFLFDEIAAAAVAAPHIFSLSQEKYSVATIDGENVSLEQSDDGRISLVRLVDQAEFEHILHGSWERNHDEFHGLGEHSHRKAGSADPLGRMKEFHGHLGPYVVLGYRMGLIALEQSGSAGHFEISAEVHSILMPPRSCLIDGVQLGSGCTLGKRNITLVETDGPPYTIFRTANGRTVTIRLRPNIPAKLKSSIDSIGVEAAGLITWKMEADSLFEISTGN